MAVLLNDPTELRTESTGWGGRPGAGQRDGLELEALPRPASGSPSTRPPGRGGARAPQGAIRLDGANPKLPYHVGRLIFTHGPARPGRRAARAGAQICSTSHRIWVHASRSSASPRVLPGGRSRRADALDARDGARRGRDGRSDRIVPALLDFESSFGRAYLEELARSQHGDGQPPRRCRSVDGSDAERLDSPGRCRWSGVGDLLAEELLEREPTRRNRVRPPPLWTSLPRAAAGGRAGGGVRDRGHRVARGGLPGWFRAPGPWAVARGRGRPVGCVAGARSHAVSRGTRRRRLGGLPLPSTSGGSPRCSPPSCITGECCGGR